MDYTLEELKRELIELRKLYQDTKKSELMYQNIVHFLLDNKVPESKLIELRNSVK